MMVQKIYGNGMDAAGAGTSVIMPEDVTVIIPVLNEEEGIGKVISDIKDAGYNKILVVDGYSTDRTVQIASNNGVKIIFQEGEGKTGALKTAFNYVDTPYLVIMDGDCTYSPGDIKNLLSLLRENNQVIGCRIYGRKNIPILNRFGNRMINIIFNVFFRSNLVDVCSGLYALHTEFAKSLVLNTKGFDVEVEIVAQATAKGKVAEVPIDYGERVGQQKLRPFRHGIQIVCTIIRMALKKELYI